MVRLWLLFTQTVTVCLGIVFVVATLRPDWLPPRANIAVPSQPRADAGEAGGELPGRDLAKAPERPGPDGAAVASYAAAVALAAPSVVTVHARRAGDSRGDSRSVPAPEGRGGDGGAALRAPSGRFGSGVVVSSEGHILTNHHVVVDAAHIDVALADGASVSATLLAADPDSDLAVLVVKGGGLTPIQFAPDHELEVGDVVLAIGNPFGLGQTATLGIVSALGHSRARLGLHDSFVQTDAPIGPGNSGGALINVSGQLVGINTAIYVDKAGGRAMGFAIPAPAASAILEQLVKHGEVARGWLGVEPQDMTQELARAFDLDSGEGVILARVLRDGPAARAGLQVGDIVTALDGDPITSARGFLNHVATRAPGSRVKLTVLREGAVKDVRARLDARPRDPDDSR